ncbi:MAG: phenylacetate-CoA oxygenase subunit PaaJ [Acidobacteriaceae bacterium]|nr:phenylacetate-CoA oxygenase subunit PaaJ [Acidobacteriaceae bacterium]
MVTTSIDAAAIWNWLGEIPDPEVPVLSIVDLGIVREVRCSEDGEVTVVVTPTYSGCPAFEVISEEIRRVLAEHGLRFRLETRLSPPWTTDWMPDAARERLREYGVAPPARLISIESATAVNPECPRCHSTDTEVLSQFGSTPCKALYRCRTCLEPFDVFKRH